METIETIKESKDIDYLYKLENIILNDISIFEEYIKKGNSVYAKKLAKEANSFGLKSLDEYLNFKKIYLLTIKEACINRIIELNKNTSS